MTSLTSIGPEQQHLEGRSVRDIVEYSPEQVNEVWCRKIFRQILQSLELQYAMHMPHRAITPDTIVFHENGEPLLIPTDVGPPDAREAEDLNALARIVHYAITHELAPTGPLAGRAEGYSESLVNAVDRCMDPDPARRPRSIEELRDLLGIVPLGPPVGAAVASHMTPPLDDIEPHPAVSTAPHVEHDTDAARAASPAGLELPSFMQGTEQPRRSLVLSRWQRWAVAAGGGAILIALAVAMFAEMRDSGSFDHIVLTLPQQGDGTHSASTPTGSATAGTTASGAGNAAPAPGLPQAAASASADGAAAVPQAAPPAPAVAAAPGEPAAAGHLPGVVVTPNGNLYKLQILPWGVVYVDDVDRGVSPPVKRLTLTPGRHTIRVTNPNFHDRVLEVDTASGDGQITVDFNAEPR
ncbi:protein kinase family protein [Massilia putida]|uniref:protein kinase family protein n=1 Tax=Massilia putida TaxID=1141883 RepID=UPI00095270F7|nr:protein kinase family protein [Massilia putida]